MEVANDETQLIQQPLRLKNNEPSKRLRVAEVKYDAQGVERCKHNVKPGLLLVGCCQSFENFAFFSNRESRDRPFIDVEQSRVKERLRAVFAVSRISGSDFLELVSEVEPGYRDFVFDVRDETSDEIVCRRNW